MPTRPSVRWSSVAIVRAAMNGWYSEVEMVTATPMLRVTSVMSGMSGTGSFLGARIPWLRVVFIDPPYMSSTMHVSSTRM